MAADISAVCPARRTPRAVKAASEGCASGALIDAAEAAALSVKTDNRPQKNFNIVFQTFIIHNKVVKYSIHEKYYNTTLICLFRNIKPD
jgi:hypothetical protein